MVFALIILFWMYGSELGAFYRNSRHQPCLIKNKPGNGMLAPEGLDREVGPCFNKRHFGVHTCLPSLTLAELVQCLVGHEKNDHVILLGTDLISERTRSKAVVLDGFTSELKGTLAVLPADDESSLGNARHDQNSLRCFQIFGTAFDFLLETAHSRVDTGIKLPFCLCLCNMTKKNKRYHGNEYGGEGFYLHMHVHFISTSFPVLVST